MSSSPTPLAGHWIAQVGSISYLIRSRIECTLAEEIPVRATHPAPGVVITLGPEQLFLDAIKKKLSRFETEDDVFTSHFTTGCCLMVYITSPVTVVPNDIKDYLEAKLTILVILPNPLPEGPYFTLGQHVHHAWRLYPDNLSAFSSTVMLDDEEDGRANETTGPRYRSFHMAAFTDSVSCVPVPSRLYFTTTEQQPLAGLRVTIKDNIHLSGVITGLGSRAYAELHGKQNTTAKYIQSLIEKGAVIVGKTKLSAFAGSEIPPNQCIDYFPPWNPRGDGYQGPSGSSSGAAATVAGYPWVDAGVCTDTSGSLRHPASSHGTWGHRIAWRACSMDGIVPAVPIYDNLGLLARSPEQLRELLDNSGLEKPTTKPKRLIYPMDWYPVANEAQQKMNEAFLQALESSLGIQHTRISLLEEWSRTAPENLRNTALTEYLGMSAIHVNTYYVYHSFDHFRREYPEKFGKQPYVSPAHKARWIRGSKVTDEERDESLDKIQVFKTWFEKEIWRTDDPEDLAVMMVPQGRPGVNYRDVIVEPTSGPTTNSYTPIFTTSMLGCPQLVIPGSDSLLVSLADEALKKAPYLCAPKALFCH
ncbi:amidase signature enzyme [Byssothecium circinans]|uniref:Amidase signature enzyme n=1 Tax=Byssothecium circinans TaxID=147558 RepID=A0A6A5TQV8_9PLEO|nr:amidase signature enzyme [Byssothecium circinans]